MNRVAFGMHNQELIANQSSSLKKSQERLQKAKSCNLMCMDIYLSCRGCIVYGYVIRNGISHPIPFTAALANAPYSSMNGGNADTHEFKVDFEFSSHQSTSHSIPVSAIWSTYILFDYKKTENEEEKGQRVKRKIERKVQ
jgi:hypothetical protein